MKLSNMKEFMKNFPFLLLCAFNQATHSLSSRLQAKEFFLNIHKPLENVQFFPKEVKCEVGTRTLEPFICFSCPTTSTQKSIMFLLREEAENIFR